nr:hypothetical protein [Sedimentibacter sp.]
MNLMKIYNTLPIFAQNLACSFEGKRIKVNRYNSEFNRILKGYNQRNNWSYGQKCEFRDKRLQKMIKYCYQSVPYYREIFDEYGINPNSINTLDDLKVIPILTKDMVKGNFKDLISSDLDKKKMIKRSTSGTTGSGLTFHTTSEAIHEQFATFWRARNNIGIEFGEHNATFGGQNIVPLNQNKPPFWRYNIPGNLIYFSVYHLNDKNIESYISEIEKKKIEWIHSYPSAISLIAQYMIENNIKLKSKVKFITTGSENLMDLQKDMIHSAFGVVPYQHYGQAENVAIFSEDCNHQIFVDEDFSAVEFIYDSNLQNYKVVGTSLNNYAMPFVRYEIGDVVDFIETSEGRQINSIDGRSDDYIVLSNGTKVGRLAHILNGVSNISESQIIQKKIGEITIKIVRGNDYSKDDENQLIKNLHTKIGEAENINIDYINEIPRTKNGKLRFVISELKK